MPMLLLILALYVLAIVGIVWAAVQDGAGDMDGITVVILVVSIVWRPWAGSSCAA